MSYQVKYALNLDNLIKEIGIQKIFRKSWCN
jgi:hypothetical protein